MPTACCLIRSSPHYRHDAFHAGLRRIGFNVVDVPVRASRVRSGDVLIIWNRYGYFDAHARQFEAQGNAVLVAENGYLPMHGTKKAFALALGHHNGAGVYADVGDRSARLDASLKPWRDGSGKVLILPQRGIGEPGIAMPKDWPKKAMAKNRGARIRRHPGTATVKPIEQDLDGIASAVTWASGAALKVLCEGVRVQHDFPRWIGRQGALGDRDAMLRDVAAAQWSVEEVETGEPFAGLLEVHETQRKCA